MENGSVVEMDLEIGRIDGARQYRPAEYDRHGIGVVNRKTIGGGGARNGRGGSEGAVRGAIGDFRRKVHPSAARREDCRLVQRRDADNSLESVVGGQDFGDVAPEVRFDKNVLFETSIRGGRKRTFRIGTGNHGGNGKVATNKEGGNQDRFFQFTGGFSLLVWR